MAANRTLLKRNEESVENLVSTLFPSLNPAQNPNPIDVLQTIKIRIKIWIRTEFSAATYWQDLRQSAVTTYRFPENKSGSGVPTR